MGAEFFYGETEDETTTEKARAHAQHNVLFGERSYGYVHAEASYNDIADIDYRVIVGPGIGYYLS